MLWPRTTKREIAANKPIKSIPMHRYLWKHLIKVKKEIHYIIFCTIIKLTKNLLHRCEGPSGYNGIRCETNVNDCIGNTCKNNATCIDLVGSYECSCSRGFTGGQCETKIAFCTGKTSDGERDGPCQNGGVCMDHFTHYTCKCKAGFTGENCTMNINDCVDNMCQV